MPNYYTYQKESAPAVEARRANNGTTIGWILRHYFETVTYDSAARHEGLAVTITIVCALAVVYALSAAKSAGWW